MPIILIWPVSLVSFFEEKLKEFNEQKDALSKIMPKKSKAMIASYKVAYRVAKCKKPHTIAEDLILPAAIEMATTMLGEEAGKALAKVPVSNNTISRRIALIAKDLNEQLIEAIQGKQFGLQLDEATDINNDAHLICNVRFINNGKIAEDLLFCKNIAGRAWGYASIHNATTSKKWPSFSELINGDGSKHLNIKKLFA